MILKSFILKYDRISSVKMSTSFSFLSRFLVCVLIHVRTLSPQPERQTFPTNYIISKWLCLNFKDLIIWRKDHSPVGCRSIWQEAPRLHYATLRSALEPPAKTDLQPSGSWSLDQNRTRASPRPILMKWHSPRNRHSHLYKNNQIIWWKQIIKAVCGIYVDLQKFSRVHSLNPRTEFLDIN